MSRYQETLDSSQLTELFNSMVHPLKRVRGFKSREEAIRAIAKVLMRTADSMDESELSTQYSALIKELKKGSVNMAKKAVKATEEEVTVKTKKGKTVSVSRQPDPEPEEDEDEDEDEEETEEEEEEEETEEEEEEEETEEEEEEEEEVTKTIKKVKKARGPRGPKIADDVVITVTVPKGTATFRAESGQGKRWEKFMENSPKARNFKTWREAGFGLSSALWAKKKGWVDFESE